MKWRIAIEKDLWVNNHEWSNTKDKDKVKFRRENGGRQGEILWTYTSKG